MNTFHQKKYLSWDIDVEYLKNNCIVYQELEEAFNNSTFFNAPERLGEGKSLTFDIIPKFSSYNFLYKFITDQVRSKFEQLQIPLYYRKKKLKLRRCWANRLYKNSEGVIHSHLNSLVVLIYLNAPSNSSDLVLVDPKHKNKLRQSESVIPLEDKLSIKVYDGMCLLHDGSILHAVSKHNNDLPRDVLVFEFESIFV